MYVVLRKNEDGGWYEVARQETGDGKSAIRRTAMDLKATNEETDYVAIPAKSFKPVRVTVLTVTQLTLDGTQDRLPRTIAKQEEVQEEVL